MVVSQYDDLPPFENIFTKPFPYRMRVWQYGLDLATGELHQNEEVADLSAKYSGEFPVISDQLVGRKSRFGYFLGIDNEKQAATGYFKIDLEKKKVAGHIIYGDGSIGGEAQYAPSLDPDADEDDGHLIVFVNTDERGDGLSIVSELRIYETKAMSNTPVAVVKIPAYIPFGFHGAFVPKADMTQEEGHVELVVERSSSAFPPA